MFHQFLNKIPVTYFGRRSLDYLREIKEEKISIIHGKSIEENGTLKKVTEQLVDKEILSISPKNNTLNEINNLANQVKGELIIAIGGGNIIDFSKLLRLKVDNPSIDLKQINKLTLVNTTTKLIVIPSTPSTGSQVTPIATTHNEDKTEKIIIINDKNIPDLVILSPQLLTSINKTQMAEFICDIFAHSVESYVSRLTNSFIQNLAEINLKKIVENWNFYKANNNDLLILEKITINGQIGGICQGNAYTGVMHAIAHQLEMMKGVSHSKALLHIIKPVLEWYKKNTGEEIYSEFIKLFNELEISEYEENIFSDLDINELIKRSLLDPSIKTSPIIFNEEKMKDIIKWISIEK